MLTHAQIWSGLDALARRFALSPSGLAKLAGLDPTTFNRSKRYVGASDKPRWPSTESIAKVLEATGASFEEFAALASDGAVGGMTIPLLRLDNPAMSTGFDAAGAPTGEAWGALAFPGAPSDALFSIEIADAEHEPLFREGDRLIAAPGLTAARGDRVILGVERGGLALGVLSGVTARTIELSPFRAGRPPRAIDVAEVLWIARILWASQ